MDRLKLLTLKFKVFALFIYLKEWEIIFETIFNGNKKIINYYRF